jgi:hypothetical protein
MKRKDFIGMLLGWALWLVLAASEFGYERSRSAIPHSIRELSDVAFTAVGVAAWPVALGGWLFVWGDGAQPPNWVTWLPFNVAVGLVLWGSLGVIAATVYLRLREPR